MKKFWKKCITFVLTGIMAIGVMSLDTQEVFAHALFYNGNTPVHFTWAHISDGKFKWNESDNTISRR